LVVGWSDSLAFWFTGFVLVGKWMMSDLADQLIFCDQFTVHINVTMKNIIQKSISYFI
jgi:hypothetical protein